MAFPPATLPTNRTNSTPQTTTHPADHNAISAAINDTVDTVEFLLDGAARRGVILVQSAQVYTAGQVAQLGWSSRSDVAWGSGATLTVPSGQGGVYIAALRVNGPTMPDENLADVVLNMDGTEFAGFIPENKTQISVCGANVMAPGDTITVTCYNPLGTSESFAGTLVIARVSV